MTPDRDPFLRDVALVARHELRDAVRSRRGMVVLLLFLAGLVGGTLLSIAFIRSIERNLARALIIEPTEGTGSMTATLWKNPSFRSTVTDLVSDASLAETLLATPPLSLFYCGLLFLLTPMLVAMTSSHRLTEELWTGASRFVLFRTSRFAWCLGKFSGQAMVLLIALLASIPVAWAVGWWRMDDYPGVATATTMLVFSLKAWVFGLAYLGMVSGVSLWVRNPGVATALGVIGLAGWSAWFHVSSHYAEPGWKFIFEITRLFAPQAYQVDLLRPGWSQPLPAGLSLLLLGLLGLMAGYLRLRRRDL
jgi:hypothetical protein